ncbi:GH13328 [Drosophila grimshawi]|uniref:GH13328 n=1 Tax=Drosophila grimshawi TaxID=7222 RepID=B4JPV8_DROGR|nr:GH13328 [Drosophila grimshawi]
MGCGSSMERPSSVSHHLPNTPMRPMQQNVDGRTIVQQYVRLDEQISKLEASSPGPRLATAEAWIEHLRAKRDTMLGLEGMEHPVRPSTTTTTTGATPNANEVRVERVAHQLTSYPLTLGAERGGNEIVANTPTKDLAQLAHNLAVIGDPQKASTHEDFFANLSESALYLLSIRYYGELLEHSKQRLKTLSESYAELNELYVKQDGIIAYISGGTYLTRLEENIDAQLEVARDTRDKLGSALEQWRICGLLLRAAANSATQALKQWQQLGRLIDPKQKLQSALDCRSLLHASLTSLEAAQLSLPHVELKYMSHRQVLAVNHCNTYLITDIANAARYEHTSRVFSSYEANISKTCTWHHDTFHKTLRSDFDKAEETVRGLARTLRDHREEVFGAARK